MSKSNLIPLSPETRGRRAGGVLLVDKPPGPTSHDIVRRIRKLLLTRQAFDGDQGTGLPAEALLSSKAKVGHSGTLDPFASGLLIIAYGQATRLIEYTHAWLKTYLVTIRLGATSDTDDLTGNITPMTNKIVSPLAKPRSEASATTTGEKGKLEGTQQYLPLDKGEIEGVLKTFTGTIRQTPPIYSAKKIGGQRLYRLARSSTNPYELLKTVGDKSIIVTIKAINLISYHYPDLTCEVTCSTGTYIRSLARDVGQALQVGAYVTSLRRTAIGKLAVKHAANLTNLNQRNLPQSILPIEILINHLPSINISNNNVAQLKKGQAIEWGNASNSETLSKLPPSQPISAFNSSSQLIAIVRFDPATTLLHPVKVLI